MIEACLNRRQLNAHCLLVFATLIGLSIGCDEECTTGVNAAGAVCAAGIGVAGGVATGLACTVGAIFTFGLSCAIAGAVTIGGAVGCSQIDSSEACKCTEQIGAPNFHELLNKLDDMNRNISSGQAQLSSGIARLNDANLRGRLEAQIWYQALNANDKTILEGQARIILRQDQAMKRLSNLNGGLKSLKDMVQLGQIISDYSSHINSIDQISKKFDRIPKGKFGTFQPSTRIDVFKNAALETHFGLESSIDTIFKMINGGGPFYSGQSVYSVIPSFCTTNANTYFTDLQQRAILMYRTALAFNGQKINKSIAKEWQEQMIRSNTEYINSCGCPSEYTFQKRGEVSTLLSKLMATTTKTTDVYKIFQKIVVIPDVITRQKMALLIEVEKFDPENPELVSLLSTFSFEDIDLVIFNVKNAKAEELQWHDGQKTCVSLSRNQEIVATASSIHHDDGPNYAIDGLVASGRTRFYHSKAEVQPWLQLEFVEPKVVVGVIFTNRKDNSGERFKNVAVHVGDQPAKAGALVTNPTCAIFVGPSATGRIEYIYCTKPLRGRYLQVQMRDSSASYLQINEIQVIEAKKNTALAIGDWHKVIGQSVSGGVFPSNHGLEYNNGSYQFISKDAMEKYKSCDGSYHFKLVWPELPGLFNEWKQTSDPTTSEVQGYQAIHVAFNKRFNGLRPCARGRQECIMRGDDQSSNWWYAAGIMRLHEGGIPGPINDDGRGKVVTQIELYIKKDC